MRRKTEKEGERERNRRGRIVAKKSLGQNFLTCEPVLRAIVGAAALTGSDTVLEVGPGMGVLTEKLLERGATVVAVEKDDRLIPFLQKKFSSERETDSKKFVLVHGDILDDNVRAMLPLASANTKTYKVVANIPYYITGQFMRLMLEGEKQPKTMILMLQREVVDRILTKDGKESLLSMAIQVYGAPRRVINVPKHCFSPMPNVDSAVIAIEDISKKFFTGIHTNTGAGIDESINEKKFFEILHAGFGQKRKQIAGNLATYMKEKRAVAEELCKKVGIDPTARAETLTREQWKGLSKLLM